jgi:hypothetical protein
MHRHMLSAALAGGLFVPHGGRTKGGPTTTERWMRSTRAVWHSSFTRTGALLVFYLAILLGLLLLYASSGSSTSAPAFVYQGF